MGDERRRPRRCPSCGSDRIVRGGPAEGIGITMTPATEEGPAVMLPAYVDACADCGLVSLFVRAEQPVERGA
jgi:hypothetical protein